MTKINFYYFGIGKKIAIIISSLSEAFINQDYDFIKKYIDLEKAGPDIEKYYESFIAPQRANLVCWEPTFFDDEIVMAFDDGGYILEPILPEKIDEKIEDSSIRMMIEVHPNGRLELKGLKY